MGSGTLSEPVAAGLRRSDLVVSAELLIGAAGAGDGVVAAVIGAFVVGEDAGAVAGGLALASGLAGGLAGILSGIGHRIGIARGGTTGIRLTFIRIRTRLTRQAATENVAAWTAEGGCPHMSI